jgi:hypothetical protein
MLKVTLVWDDYPGDPLAGQALVNDLDLVVTGPDGTQRYPWTLDPSVPEKPAERMRADHANNVEQVTVEDTAEGWWLVTVCGTTVPQPPQMCALIMGSTALAEGMASGPENWPGDIITCNGSLDDKRR